MLRCVSAAAAVATALFAIPVAAQQPLNGEAARLAPGARIRGVNTMVLLSGSAVGSRLLVHYTLDTFGLVKDVWVLREDEAKKFWPRSADEAAKWKFDPATQSWVRP